jgi:Tfp pilus assembly protein PilV
MHRRAGLTMVEILISTVIFAAVLGLVGLTMITGTGAYEQDMESSKQISKSSSLLDSTLKKLTMVQATSLNPDPTAPWGASSLQFRQLDDWTAGAIVWSDLRRLEWQLATGELNNGLDDNANGLVDEGRVVLITDDGGLNELTTTLGKDVAEYLEGETANGLDDNANGLIDERGLCFERKGKVLIVRLTTLTVGDHGSVTPKSSTSAIKLEL